MNEKISALPTHTLNSADIIPVAEGGANYGDTVGQIETAAAALVPWSALLGDLTETQVIPFDGPTPGTADSGISRLAAASLAIGNGTAGDKSGSLSLTYILNGGFDMYIQGDASGSGWQLGYYQSGLGLGPTASVFWGSVNAHSMDAGISRLAAASLAIGNGTAGDYSGSLKLTHLVFPSAGDETWNGDTSISRVSPNVIQIGNTSGTPDASGTLKCATLIEGSTLTPASATTAGVTGQIAWQGTNGTTGQIFICTSGGTAGSAIWMAATLAKV
jgi:hypothetical protein